MKILPSCSASFLTCILQKEPVSQVVNLKWAPILIETGEASYHAMFEYCIFEILK